MAQNETCSFAQAGTYGHECGKPATHVRQHPSKLTIEGIFYARRCEEHATVRGGENSGTTMIGRFDPAKHINRWR
jgi:hypothetical protein